MSKSRKRQPFCGNAAHSDKPYKQDEHRRWRRFVRILLKIGECIMPPNKTFGSPYNSCKDGKHRLDEETKDKWMRK